jgi:hypothetical protein
LEAPVFGALGDIHGDFETSRTVMRRHPEAAFWVCVGDVADDRGRYEPLDAPLYWIKGNNENFDAIASGDLPSNLHYIPAATPVTVSGLTLVGLGGTLAPTWYHTPAAELPFPGMTREWARSAAAERQAGGAPRAEEAPAAGARRPIRDDKRRHFVKEEVEKCKALRGVDLFMTHEAPRPFLVGGRSGRRGIDAGKTPINEVLAAMKPRLHLFGHHHRFSEQERQGVRSVGLDVVGRSYLIVDGSTLEYRKVETL